MNILITGGAGFIGSHVADACVAAGHLTCVVDDLSMGRRENLHPEVEFVQLDIRSDKLWEMFDRVKFDVVIHHAAQMDVRKSVEDPLFDASVNIIGTLNLLEICRAHGVKQFIFASTGGAIYGDQSPDEKPADELHPTKPISPYGVSKLTIENYLHYYRTVFGLTHVVLRYGNVYGPRQNPHGEAGVIAIFTGKMLAGGQPVINGDGRQTRDYVYVEDVVKANMLALTYDRSGIFNVGTGIETNVNELFAILRELTSSQCEEQHAEAKKGEQQRSVLDATNISRTLGWAPGVALREGLRRTVDSFRNRPAF